MNEFSNGWLSRLKSGLSRTSKKLNTGISAALTRRTLNAETLETLEEVLISADLGVATASKLTGALAKGKFEKEVSDTQVCETLASSITEILRPIAIPLEINSAYSPHVILVVGVNGSGKTTTIGKLAKSWSDDGKSVILAAGDTFRAAAVEQLKIWGERTNCPVISGKQGSDAAGLAFDALEQSRKENADILLIDTAGRLQNREDLMSELTKIIRVLRKIDPKAPHSCLLILDATVGQNAHSQVETFKEITNVSGLIMTKLDGTARGGVVVALAERFGLPVHAVGVGEGEDDLHSFDAEFFARNLLGLK